jgi:phage/plasmid primase-like uncharacterized protein
MAIERPLQIGKFVRCQMADQKKRGKKSAWYYYYGDNLLSDFATGIYGDWRDGSTCEWFSKQERELTSQERAAYQAALKIAKEKRDEEQRTRHNEAAERAQALIDDSVLAIGHDYLARKGVKAYGVYVNDGVLLVPMRSADGLVRSVQRIWPNGDKRFLAGGQVSGCYHLIGSTLTEPTYVVEGYATGATVHEVTGKSVVVAFNASNIEPAVRAIRDAGNGHQLVIAADNDRKTDGNPGVTAAKKTAASGFMGVSVAIPEFKGSEGTDFNDLYMSEGVARVMQCLGLGEADDNLLVSVKGESASPPSWLIKGVLPSDGLGVLFGPSGGGKSFVALDMALSIAAGRDWHGRKLKRPGAVIYVCGEGQQGIVNRVRAWEKHTGVSVDDLPFRITRLPVRFLDAGSVARLLKAIDAQLDDLGGNVSFLAVDTVNRNFGDGDENSTKDMTRFVDSLTDVQKQLDCTLMAVHHTGLGDGDRARGSSALRAALDFEIQHRVVGEDQPPQVCLAGKKMKDGSQMTECLFELTFVPLGVDEDGDDYGSLVLDPMADDKVSAAMIADGITRKNKKAKGTYAPIALPVVKAARQQILTNQPDTKTTTIEKSWLSNAVGEAMIEAGQPKKKQWDAIQKLVDYGVLVEVNSLVFEITQLADKYE